MKHSSKKEYKFVVVHENNDNYLNPYEKCSKFMTDLYSWDWKVESVTYDGHPGRLVILLSRDIDISSNKY